MHTSNESKNLLKCQVDRTIDRQNYRQTDRVNCRGASLLKIQSDIYNQENGFIHLKDMELKDEDG